MDYDFDVLLRLAAAVVAGLAIGFNRDVAHKALGMRTLALVALGAAVVTIAGMEYTELDDAASQSRILQGIIQGVLTGIGFLGAGAILRDQQSQQVHGLTTAATVWITAALGIGCALGAWLPVAAGIVLSILVLFALEKLEQRFWPDRDGPPH
ncbi:MAG: Mg(2+)-transport-ATPase-associated protein MgtC [Pseudolabrys sp.]|jgi:putative Mg2+ transporter-C (MgtC) family protein|nr:Mg(2+)-transport-ATPase-associated protein MgtC [Pseudolabrys sp.]